MVDDATTPEGTAGEPGTAAAGSQGEAVETQAQPQQQSGEPVTAADDAMWEKLRTIPWDKVPQDIRSKAEEPFLRQYTRKTTELNERQARQLDAITQRLAAQGVEATPDIKAELKQRIQEGDMSVLDTLLDRMMEERLKPVGDFMFETSMNSAIQQAAKLHPWVSEKEQEITEFLQKNPAVLQAAAANRFAAAPTILAGIASHLENQYLKATRQADIEKALAADRAKARSLPASTSKAGSTPSQTPVSGSMNLREAMEAAYAEVERQVGR